MNIRIAVLLLAAGIAAAHAEDKDKATPKKLANADLIAHLILVDKANAVELTIHRMKIEYERELAKLNAEHQSRLRAYGEFIRSKRAEYKVGETWEIVDMDWKDMTPPPAPLPRGK